MGGVISYLNTDLDLTSVDDLKSLAEALELQGVFPLHVTKEDDGLWLATFETETQHSEPEPNISAMLDAVESLTQPLKEVWMGCGKREMNIGYDCGDEPWEFNQGFSTELLGRMAAACTSLRFTIYPNREPVSPMTSGA